MSKKSKKHSHNGIKYIRKTKVEGQDYLFTWSERQKQLRKDTGADNQRNQWATSKTQQNPGDNYQSKTGSNERGETRKSYKRNTREARIIKLNSSQEQEPSKHRNQGLKNITNGQTCNTLTSFFLLGTSVQLLVNTNIYKESVTSYLLIYDVTEKLFF